MGNIFTVQRSGSSVALRLVAAEPIPVRSHPRHPARDAHHERFSLLFEGAANCPLGQDTLDFSAAGMKRFSMFIVPLRRDPSRGALYEAIFNRPVSISSQEVHHG